MKSLIAKLFTWTVVVAQATAMSGHALHHAAEPAPESESGCGCPHARPIVPEAGCGHESLPEQRHDCDTCVLCEAGTPTSLTSSQGQSKVAESALFTYDRLVTTATLSPLRERPIRVAEQPPQTRHRIVLPLLI